MTNPIPVVTEEMVSHIFRYGGKCRECGDNFNICEKSGLSCDLFEAGKSIRFVLEAYAHYLSQRSLEPPMRGEVESDQRQMTVAAAAIVDVWMGGNKDWRGRLCDSDFLESADWQ